MSLAKCDIPPSNLENLAIGRDKWRTACNEGLLHSTLTVNALKRQTLVVPANTKLVLVLLIKTVAYRQPCLRSCSGAHKSRSRAQKANDSKTDDCVVQRHRCFRRTIANMFFTLLWLLLQCRDCLTKAPLAKMSRLTQICRAEQKRYAT